RPQPRVPNPRTIPFDCPVLSGLSILPTKSAPESRPGMLARTWTEDASFLTHHVAPRCKSACRTDTPTRVSERDGNRSYYLQSDVSGPSRLPPRQARHGHQGRLDDREKKRVPAPVSGARTHFASTERGIRFSLAKNPVIGGFA